MIRKTAALVPALLLALCLPAFAEEKPAPAEKPKPEVTEKTSRTRHTITLGGQAIPYTATAGTLVLKEEDGTPKASFFYIAYTKEGVKDPATRPVTFSFNGGPGAAALWVNLGAFGPKVVELDPEGMPLPPPSRLKDNDLSILDVSDLVFIDPISTGFSRPAPGEDAKQFHGVDNDIAAVGSFIRLWLTRNARWGSPKFLAGESYGTSRAAGLASHLLDRYGMELNGIVLISVVLNWQNQEFNIGNDMPYLIYLPTYAAVAWYHKKLPPELSGDLRRTLDEVERFAMGDYALALLQGDRLPAERRREIAARVARYTGLSPEYVERSNLRIEHIRFCKELLRDRGRTVGRLDGRFLGADLDSAGEYWEFDPSLVGVDGPYVSAMNDYVRRELGFEADLVYERLTGNIAPWASPEYQNRYVNMAEPLRQAMMKSPSLQVLITSGYYDMATPYFDGVYTAGHLGLPESEQGRVRSAFYESGHMMYIRRKDHEKFKKDVADFIVEASRPSRRGR